MVLTVIGLLVLIGFALTIANAVGKCPLWVPVLLLYIVEMLRILPLGR
jgi:hypothetical protein